MRGGIPLGNYSLGDYLSGKAYIGNIGNFMFINAVVKSMMVDDAIDFHPTFYRSHFTDEEVDFANQYYDAFVMPLADAFRDDNIRNLKGLAAFIHRLTIPCYVIGVGFRAPFNYQSGQNKELDSAVRDFVRAVLDKSSMIGVRGANTGDYLKRLGFTQEKDFTVIGCPSVSVLLPGKRVAAPVEYKKILLITNTLAPKSVSQAIMDMVDDWSNVMVVAQKEMELEDIYLGKLSRLLRRGGVKGTVENVFGNELYNRLYCNGQIKTFSNLHSWLSEIKGNDLCVSTRFHGAIAAMASGIPTVIVPFDARMREMVEYHQLPAISFDQIGGQNIAELISRVDTDSYLSVWRKNKEHYIEFLKRNDIDNIFTHSFAEGQTPYDRTVGKIIWEPSALNFSEISMTEKFKRFSCFYGGKVKNKLDRNVHSIIVQ